MPSARPTRRLVLVFAAAASLHACQHFTRSGRMKLADASLVVLSERYDCLELLTLDERHFRALRGAGGKRFRLVPAARRS